ncbi:hypothetical protein HH308_05775 [Gordonia sp. TBRC 11910]|uniref:HTH luxR-type domain-containing protein n=1 Tax=Gordonia asplenii TaxID=2725283 RepID=A0A848KW89_9ACTN|nr:LuxR family transcriptional regulator [Gordonia asplenii]NMO00723.1 hypothetical protein [Gordonia asplenii]
MHDIVRTRFFEQARVLVDDPGAGGLLLVGPLGVGKTTLAQAILAGRTVTALTAADCTAERLRDFAHRPDDSSTGRAERRGTSTGRAGSSIVWIADADRLDPAAGAMLWQLTAARATRVLLTARSAIAHPALYAMWKDNHVHRLSIPPFSLDDTAALVESRIPGRVHRRVPHQIQRLSGGIPLISEALMSAAIDSETLQTEFGVAQLHHDIPLSPTLRAILDRFLAPLTATQRDVATILSIAANLPLAVLNTLCDGSAIDECEASGLIDVDAGGDATLRIRILASVIDAELSDDQRRDHARRISAAFTADLAVGDTWVITPVMMKLIAGIDQPTGALVDAAAHELRIGHFQTADMLARQAITRGDHAEPTLILAQSLMWRGRARECEQLLAAGDPPPDATVRARTISVRAANMFWFLLRPDDALTLLREARATLPADSDGLFAIDALRATFHYYLGESPVALEICAELGEPRDRDALSTAWLYSSKAAALLSVGRPAEAQVPIRLSRAASSQVNTGLAALINTFNQLEFYLLTGRFEKAGRFVAEVAQAARDDGDSLLSLANDVISGRAAHMSGDLLAAEDHYARALSLASRSPQASLVCACSAWLSQVYSLLGRVTEAKSSLQIAENTAHRVNAHQQPAVEMARALYRMATSDLPAARLHAADAVAFARSHEMAGVELDVRFDAEALGLIAPDADFHRRARQGSGGQAAVVFLEALAGDADTMSAAAEQMTARGRLIWAAEGFALAALKYATEDAKLLALKANWQSRAIVATTLQRTPAVAALPEPPTLSRREIEILTEVARGVSNRDIADDLVVSVRTVEGHVYRLMHKLGARRRDELSILTPWIPR